MTTTVANGENKPNIIRKQININHFTQSHLQTLSLTTIKPTTANDDIVSPKLDPSLFNLSASSRRQTYSRLPKRRSHSRFPVKPHLITQFNSSPDPVTHSIVHYFKHFIYGNHNPPPPPPLITNINNSTENKRKRGGFDELGRFNGKGEVVDFEKLGKNGDFLFDDELRKRTSGIDSEEGVFGVLEKLDGEWGSRRRRRKYVDAAGFGDLLPVGWKLLLALKRKDYHVSLYCRRYVSPTGEHFTSCREIASFLKSYFGDTDADQQKDQKTCSIQQAYIVSSVINGSPEDKPDLVAFNKAAHSTVAISSSNAYETDDHLMGIENLPEVKIRDSFECVKCNVNFGEKDVYFQHLLAYHQKTTKRYKFGPPVGEGVIIRDGKFECQFCHKVFNEKRSYSGHVGIHVRGKIFNELSTAVTYNKDPEPPLQKTLPSISPKMDSQGSTVETSNAGNSNHASTQQANVLKLEEPQIDCSNNQATLSSDPVAVQTEELKLSSDAIVVQTEEFNLSSVPIEVQTEDSIANKSPNEQLNHVSHAVTENNDMVTNNYEWNINMDSNCLNDGMGARTREIVSYGNSNLEMDIGRNHHLEVTPGLNLGEMVFQDGVSTVPLTQSFDFFPSFDSASNKVEHAFSVVDQKLENVTGFAELRFDDIEPFKYGYMNELTGQDLPSLPGCSMNLGSDGRIEEHGFNSSVRFHPQEVMLNTADASQLTVCVWCRTEFRLDVIELENPSGSIAYNMCPTCKSRVSGHFGGGGGLSMGPHGF